MHSNSPVMSLGNPLEPTPRQHPEPDRLALALQEIAADAQQRGAAYLRDTVVPEGGE